MFNLTSPLFLLVALIFISGFRKISCQDFSYDGPKGPLHWGDQYNRCDGKYQSPINIDPKFVNNVQLPPLVFSGFDTWPASSTIKNTGHTAQVTMDFKETATVSGGPLNGDYEFSQFHFHWGDNDNYGSESQIDFRSFPVELHMVFYKTKYSQFQNALEHTDGITVLACLFEVAEDPNPSFEELTILLNDIIKPDTETAFLNPPKLMEFLSSDIVHYYTYNGSLTTPPCSEAVTWIDFATPIPISSKQIESFRRIRDRQGLRLKHNSRPIQPLNGRVVNYNTDIIDFQVEPKNDFKYDINDIRYEIVVDPSTTAGTNYEKHINPENNSVPTIQTINKTLAYFYVLFLIVSRF